MDFLLTWLELDSWIQLDSGSSLTYATSKLSSNDARDQSIEISDQTSVWS